MTLRSKVLSGLYWTGGLRLLGQIFAWCVTLLVIRILRPEDYGLLAMATIFVAFLSLMADVGLGQALIQVEHLDSFRVRQIFGTIIMVDVSLFILQFIFAPLIAGFFAEPRLTDIIRALGIQYLLAIFTAIPTTLLTRQLDFKRLSLLELGGAMAGSVSTLVLALQGMGVWSLVFGTLIAATCKTIACNILMPYHQWPRFSLNGAHDLIKFGGQVTIARALWFIYSQSDIFIAGKMLGKDSLGVYSVAMHLASLPVQKISSILNQVAFPAFARVQDNIDQAASHLLKAVRILSFFAFPILWGMSTTASALVSVLLGPQWSGAVLPLQVLALVMPVRMIGNFIPSATDGLGRADIGVVNLVIGNTVMIPAFIIGSQWGIMGLCVAWIIVSPLVFLMNLVRSLPALDIKVSRVLHAMGPSAFCALLMCAALKFTELIFPTTVSAILRLGIQGVSGAIIYMILSIALNRSAIREIHALKHR